MTRSLSSALATRGKRFFRRALGAFRLYVFFACVFLVLATLLTRATLAQADDAMLKLGQHLSVIASETAIDGDGSRVYLNGQILAFHVEVTDASLDEALDFHKGICDSEGGRSYGEVSRDYREEKSGYVVCVKHGLASISESEREERLDRFTETGNMAELGQFHYAMAQVVDDGVRVVNVRSEGDFYPLRLFPETGDAPGFEPEAFTRPASGQRMLSAGQVGDDESMALYINVTESREELERFYRGDFARKGWHLLGSESLASQSVFALQHGSVLRVVSILEEDDDTRTVSVASGR